MQPSQADKLMERQMQAVHTLPSMALHSLDRDRGGLLVRDMYNRFSTTLLKLLSVRLARKVYSCRHTSTRSGEPSVCSLVVAGCLDYSVACSSSRAQQQQASSPA